MLRSKHSRLPSTLGTKLLPLRQSACIPDPYQKDTPHWVWTLQRPQTSRPNSQWHDFWCPKLFWKSCKMPKLLCAILSGRLWSCFSWKKRPQKGRSRLPNLEDRWRSPTCQKLGIGRGKVLQTAMASNPVNHCAAKKLHIPGCSFDRKLVTQVLSWTRSP